MREKRHTKGPWVFMGGRFNGGEGKSVSKIGSIFSETEDFYICEIEDATGYEANANLISAAPELLEALEEAERFFNNVVTGNDTRSESDKVRSMMDSAIKKAYGETE